jgi:hypothetical protein
MTAITQSNSKVDARPRQPRRQISPSPLLFWKSQKGSNKIERGDSFREETEKPITTVAAQLTHTSAGKHWPTPDTKSGIPGNAFLSPTFTDKEPTKPFRRKSIGPDDTEATSSMHLDEDHLSPTKDSHICYYSSDQPSLKAALLASYKRGKANKPQHLGSW